MDRLLRCLLFSLLLFPISEVYADNTLMISPSVGTASVSNIDGYDNSQFFRVDGTLFPIPQVGINIFAVNYQDFENNSGANSVKLTLEGQGFGLIGRWPINEQLQPYLRLEYFSWDVELKAFSHTISKDSSNSTGLGLGVQFTLSSGFGLKLEAMRYNDVSGADINQLALGATFEF